MIEFFERDFIIFIIENIFINKNNITILYLFYIYIYF